MDFMTRQLNNCCDQGLKYHRGFRINMPVLLVSALGQALHDFRYFHHSSVFPSSTGEESCLLVVKRKSGTKLMRICALNRSQRVHCLGQTLSFYTWLDLHQLPKQKINMCKWVVTEYTRNLPYLRQPIYKFYFLFEKFQLIFISLFTLHLGEKKAFTLNSLL